MKRRTAKPLTPKDPPREDRAFDGMPDVPVTEPENEAGLDLKVSPPEDNLFRIWIVWCVGVYPNGVRLLDLRAITTSLGKAKLYSKMLRRDKRPSELWTRIVIEPRVANHLYGERWREFEVNTGRL